MQGVQGILERLEFSLARGDGDFLCAEFGLRLLRCDSRLEAAKSHEIVRRSIVPLGGSELYGHPDFVIAGERLKASRCHSGDPVRTPATEAIALMRTCCAWVQVLGTYRAATTVLEPD